MPYNRTSIVAAGGAIALLVASFTASVAATQTPDEASASPSAPAAGATPAPASGGLPQGSEPVELDAGDFTTDIDNPWWPMAPGTRWIYAETDEEGKRQRVTVTVTSETKVIANGIDARVVRDTVTQDGAVVEDTFDWYAQDADGNVWYLGEDTAEFEDGEVVSTSGSFEAGVDSAHAGVVMPADPTAGMHYRQEYYAGEAEDRGAILSTDEQVGVPYGHFDDAILTKDTNALEPDVLEYKLYARGIGPVLAISVSGGGGREELIKMTTVDDRTAKAAATTPLGEDYP